MKKLFILMFIFSFFDFNVCFASYNSEIQDKQQLDIKTNTAVIIKKDPKIIKLQNKNIAEKKSYEEKMKKDEKEYKKVKDTMGEGYYTFYKISDRIIRANDLDTQNWRFQIKKKTDEINAYANTSNLVTLYSSLLDSFYDNEDALAFVIGHEISHHALEHMLAYGRMYDELSELSKIIEMQNIGTVLFLPYVGLRYSYICKKMRKYETAADSEAIVLMAKAGYNVDYANDVMDTFGHLLSTDKKHLEDTHPKPYERIKNINKVISKLDIEELNSEGAKNLYEKPVMNFKRSSDKKTLVLIPEKNRGTFHYIPLNEQQRIIYDAYKSYIKEDLKQSEALFLQAYKLDKKNYIPCLYLSYINEYYYLKNNNKDSLNKAVKWAKKAYNKHKSDKLTVTQKMDTEKLKNTNKQKSKNL